MASETEERRSAFLAGVLPAGPWDLAPLGAGGNNRTYLVHQGRERYVLKENFRHPADRRDRATAEFAFARFAWSQGLRCLPEPLACDPTAGMALFGFVAGERIAPGALGPAEVQQAMDFVMALNGDRHQPSASDLPEGAEACFSLNRHLQVVDARLARLEQLPPAEDLDREARDLARGKMRPLFDRMADRIRQEADRHGMAMDQALTRQDRVISPSDFGFHNALRRHDGTLAFLDFEYAGWDDPAKLSGDFFSQVQVPVPLTHWDLVRDTLSDLVDDPASARKRMTLLRPLYQLKWCCIVLNHFLPVAAARRSFAGQDPIAHKRGQLHQAQAMLRAISNQP